MPERSDACFYFDADSGSDGRSLSWTPCVGELLHREELASKLNDKAFSRTFEWEERVGLCTTELVMFEVAMEFHGGRFRTSDHSTVSLEPLKETLFKSAAARRHERSPYTAESLKTSNTMTTGAKGDNDMWRGQANVEYIVMDERRDPRLEGA